MAKEMAVMIWGTMMGCWSQNSLMDSLWEMIHQQKNDFFPTSDVHIFDGMSSNVVKTIADQPFAVLWGYFTHITSITSPIRRSLGQHR